MHSLHLFVVDHQGVLFIGALVLTIFFVNVVPALGELVVSLFLLVFVSLGVMNSFDSGLIDAVRVGFPGWATENWGVILTVVLSMALAVGLLSEFDRRLQSRIGGLG